mgnify:CR=1 FL=1
MYYDFNLTVHRQHLTELEGLQEQTSETRNPGPSANWRKERDLAAARVHTFPADHSHKNKTAWTGLFATLFGNKRAQF